jgi:hypothetical protein
MNTMKNLKTPSRFRIAGMCFVALLCMLQFSCLKDNNNYVAPQTALLMVVQGSAGAPGEILYLNNNRVNYYQSFNYGDHIGYFNAYTGTRQVILYNYASAAKIASDTIHLNNNVAYSLFLANTYTSPDFILLTDSIAQPAAGKATIRFVNISPDAGAVDLSANSTVLVSDKAYKGSSTFRTVAGGTNYNFEILKTGTNTVLAKLDTIPINSGSVYTVWLHGLKSGSGTTQLSADIIKNAFY